MNFDLLFFVNSILLGMAFSANNFVYSMKNANNFKTLETKQTNLYSGIFSLVQLGFTFFVDSINNGTATISFNKI